MEQKKKDWFSFCLFFASYKPFLFRWVPFTSESNHVCFSVDGSAGLEGDHKWLWYLILWFFIEQYWFISWWKHWVDFFFSRIHFLHFMSYFFTASVGNYINYMTYVVMLIGYLTYILIDIPHFMYYLCLLVTRLWYKMQRDNQNILAT